MTTPISNDEGSPQDKTKLLKLNILPSDILIVDRWLDVAFAVFWFIIGLWGAVSLVIGLPTITQLTNDWYQTAWSGMIGLLSITASILATLVFFETFWISQVTKKVLELGIVIVLGSFMAVYPVLLVVRSFEGEFLKTGALAVLCFSFLVFPVYRIHDLKRRIKNIKGAESIATGTNPTV